MRVLRTNCIYALLLPSAFTLFQWQAFPQSRIVGSISGTVKDPAAAAVPNAKVALFPDFSHGSFEITDYRSGREHESRSNHRECNRGRGNRARSRDHIEPDRDNRRRLTSAPPHPLALNWDKMSKPVPIFFCPTLPFRFNHIQKIRSEPARLMAHNQAR
jgi:hypothetical protein